MRVLVFHSEISGCNLRVCLDIYRLRSDRMLTWLKTKNSRINFDSKFFNLQKNGACNSRGIDQLLVVANAKV